MGLAELRERLAALPGAGVIAVRSLAQLRESRTVDNTASGSDAIPPESFRLRRGPHPSGYPTTLPLPTWIRPGVSHVTALAAAPAPGAHTADVLRECGYSDAEIGMLIDSGVAQTGWKCLQHYLPR